MKNLKTFESFINESDSKTKLVFDFMPFDKNPEVEKNSVTLEEITSINPEDLKEGLYVAHVPGGDGGFTRYILKSLTPPTFDSAIFDSNMSKKQEIPGLHAEDLGDYLYRSSEYGLI